MVEDLLARDKRAQWYRESRFGMFIHFGLYSVAGREEWVKSIEHMSNEAYQKYFDAFDPTDLDMRAWAKLAKQAGMKYAVLTAKHHDGFCLFDTATTDYKSTKTACKRDLVAEFLEAFRAEGLRVGLYFSLLDWYHPHYPHFGDRAHPMRDNEAFRNYDYDFEKYLDYMHSQITELLTNYGKLDIMWFDYSYNDMKGERWRASQIIEKVRSLQPEMLIDNRLEASGHELGSIVTANPMPYAGDFACPEQVIPPEGLTNELGKPIPWESCITLNKHWGYCASDAQWKSARLVVRALVECVSKGGNLLVNVGPNGNGRIPEQSVKILQQVGGWMHKNSASIYGCGVCAQPKPDWGRFTQKGNLVYAHIFEEGLTALRLPQIKQRYMRRLADNAEIKLADFWTLKSFDKHLFFFLYPNETHSYPLPDALDTVVEITLESGADTPHENQLEGESQ